MMNHADELMNAVSVFQLEGDAYLNRRENRATNSGASSKTTNPYVRLVSTKSAPIKQVEGAIKLGSRDWEEF